MRLEELLQWVRAVPFQSFRIYLNSGKTYDIRHPGMIRVGLSDTIIYAYEGEQWDIFDRAEMVGLELIERTEPLATATRS
jgi:hypothetical protein